MRAIICALPVPSQSLGFLIRHPLPVMFRCMQDRYGHRISYLRVSITDRCNERCTYCMPQELQEWLPREEILTFEETLRLIRIAAELGVSKVRITGGEPLTRRDVVDFIRRIPEIPGIKNIGLEHERWQDGRKRPRRNILNTGFTSNFLHRIF